MIITSEEEIRRFIDNIFDDPSMNEYKNHTFRVVKICKHIGSKEGANMDILISAAYFHDIGRIIRKDIRGHVEKSVFLANIILKEWGYNDDIIEQIIIAIEDHHKNDVLPRNIEGKILYDADKLEIVGELGIARWFFGAGSYLSLEDAAKKYLSIATTATKERETFFITPSGKQLGDNAFYYSLEFCKKILDEVK